MILPPAPLGKRQITENLRLAGSAAAPSLAIVKVMAAPAPEFEQYQLFPTADRPAPPPASPKLRLSLREAWQQEIDNFRERQVAQRQGVLIPRGTWKGESWLEQVDDYNEQARWNLVREPALPRLPDATEVILPERDPVGDVEMAEDVIYQFELRD